MADIEVPVLIVGAGPAGLATSKLLSGHGVRHLLVEKYPGTAHTPRAHIVNQRTVEIFRHMGIEDRLLAVATPHELMSNNVWSTSLAGLEVARLQAWGTGPDRAGDYRKASPSPMVNCPQTVLEPVLLDAAREHPQADIRFSHEFLTFSQDDDGITATVVDHGTGSELAVRSQYLIGADGGRSRVVEQAGLPIEGETGLGAVVNVWFEADLSRYLAHRPGVLYWNVSPGTDFMTGAGMLVCHRPWTEFVMSVIYNPATESYPHTEEFAVDRIRRIVGDDTLKPDVKNISGWTINHQVASRYSEGRVFCMGDAVHRHPPTNGLGLNTSIADAFNLAWKLAAVLRDQAEPALLDTYSAERQPVGRQVVDRALASGADMAGIPAALGFAPGQSEEDGWAALGGLYEPGAEGDRRRAALREAVELTHHQFNAHGVELDYRYRDGAVVPDGSPEPSPDRDAELYHHPTTWPGAHLPHAWLDRDGHRISTLDLVEGTSFSLLTGIGGESWADAARAASAATGIGIDVHPIGTRDGLLDVDGTWERLREVQVSGAVLVRPDRHVAWRSASAVADAAEQLTAVMRRLTLPVAAEPQMAR
ncbi:FAD-dependent monooxygenase [Streptomyces sp. GbtcB7]|uniref:FAD-dependent monooxygenase n=1 Tax=Streptomyces sp. GbtcB7 TaxID=2824752 RepID=UPI001C301F6A|nr:FAD-dependent monooxygenase [Streptomyces sp. GbtcB7]